MQEHSKIIERIRKLLALSQSSNEHEAALALAKAQGLLAEHNLSMAQVQAQTGARSAYRQELMSLISRDNWRRALLATLANHNFCRVIVLGTDVSLIGERDNIAAVQLLYLFVIPQLERLAASSYRVYESQGGTVGARTWKNNFFLGAVRTIGQRLQQERQAFEAQSNACRSLLVVKERDLCEAVRHFYPKRRQMSVRYRSAPDGYARGQEAGKQVQFRREVNGPGARW